ncbi:TIGR03943 family protein [Caldibacillus lycopersici]|uniref:TIGR03943 family protein n=1 Tax=Perspicuibacillus lycopersici TaxID=1325689 RepID=A0AAE3ISZ1_9BACI|nr:TIGR03943 family protein [Perspicuibacillus lycopersici]MCU9612889.1 TIGR03943 family protein [Perspicuibacillus lycopersici]
MNRLQHFIRAVILAAFAIFFVSLHYSGDIMKYINPKYDIFSKIAAILFIVFFIIQIFRIWENPQNQHEHCPPGCTHDHGYSASLPKKVLSYFILVFPLLTGFAFAPTVLNSSIAENKGTILPQANNAAEKEKAVDDPTISNNQYIDPSIQNHETAQPRYHILSTEEYDSEIQKLKESEVIVMEDTIYEPYYGEINMNLSEYIGRKIKVVGFVYREEGLADNQLVISRFLISHCIADASIVGFLSEFPEAKDLKQDTWIEMEGIIEATTYNGVEIPIIKPENWKQIEQPSIPYIYPILQKVE